MTLCVMNHAYYALYFMIVLNLCLPHAHAQVVVVAIFDTKITKSH